ncbi:hypothetical protein ACO0QE_003560 [Hanseniaspora vineae]
MNYYIPNETSAPDSRSGYQGQPDPRAQGFPNGIYQSQPQQPVSGTNDFFSSVIDEISQLRMPLDTKSSQPSPTIPCTQGRQSAPPTGLRQNTLMNFANSASNLSTPIPQTQTSPVYNSFNSMQIRTPSFPNMQMNPAMNLSPQDPIDTLISLELENSYNNNNNTRKSSLFMESSVSMGNMTPTAHNQGNASFLKPSSTSTLPAGTSNYSNITQLNNSFIPQNTNTNNNNNFPSFDGMQNEAYMQNSDLSMLQLSDLQLSDNGLPLVNNEAENKEVPILANTNTGFQNLPQQYRQGSINDQTAQVGTTTAVQTEETSAKKSSTVSTPRTPLSASHSHSNYLSDLAIESLQRQRNQSKLIHLDPIPDFQDRKEIKPWLQRIFYPLGIEIVIERSDATKVIFKCKALKKADIASDTTGLQNLSTKTKEAMRDSSMSPAAAAAAPKSSSLPTAQPKKYKRTVSLYNQCPFRIRATLSVKRQKWNIVVVNNGHSHSLKFNFDSDDYRKFKQHLKDMEDWETVKKFDELEYRAKSNLPTNLTTIPCECGLTEEVISFDVVLPSAMTGGLLHSLKSNHHNTHSDNGQSPATSLGSRKPGSGNKQKGTKSLQQQIGRKKSLETQLDTFMKVEQFLNNNEHHHGGDGHDVMGLTTHVQNTPLQGQIFQQQRVLQQPIQETNTQLPDLLDDAAQFEVPRDVPAMTSFPTNNHMDFNVSNQSQTFLAPVDDDNLFNANEIDFTELFLKPSTAPSLQQTQQFQAPQQYTPSTKPTTNKSKKSSGLPQFKHLGRNNAPSNPDFENDISSGTTEPGNTINYQNTNMKPQQTNVGDLLIKELDEMQLLDNERYLLPSPGDYNQSPATEPHDI